MKLSKIADISSGLVLARKKALTNKGFDYEVLTLKSLNENGYIEDDFLDNFISEEKIKEQYLTKEGDIVVRLSTPNTAVYIEKEQEGIIIPSLFIIIRIHSSSVISKFLQIYFNSEKCKRQLAADTIGSVLSIVKTSSFKELDVPKYSIEQQKNIINLNELIVKEKKLLNQLLNEKEKYHKAIMSKMFN
ncbi:restriction endonuclease subunit S [Clostridium botulinum]|nr:restriction endonuclease subunit S [Clostridium botulinum]